ERIVRLWETWGPGTSGSVSLEDFADWKQQSRGLELMTAIEFVDRNLAKPDRAERIGGLRVSADFFPLLAVRPAIGRPFPPEGHAAEEGAEVLLSHDVWQRFFGGEPGIVGTTVTLSDKLYTVVGVLPAGFQLPSLTPGVILPLGPKGHGRGSHYLFTLARLAP